MTGRSGKLEATGNGLQSRDIFRLNYANWVVVVPPSI